MTPEQTTDELTDDRTVLAVVGGFFGGIASFAITYGTLYLVTDTSVAGQIGAIASFHDLLGGSMPADWTVAGWAFFEAHNVGLSDQISTAGPTMSGTVTLKGSPLWNAWFPMVPVVVLLLAGVVLAWAARATGPGDGFRIGASVTFGYLPPVLLGLFAFAWGISSGGGGYYVAPNFVSGILLGGVIYPVVFGGVGGAIGSRVG